ncbi:lipid IV(A) palmitoyltransferase PagP [Legionella nagasakiensis]|uniref:lipid IV(A) palmitoyltransferase PagP n=1 Tax=Legionella nagasakiensis TaxID=535290 RepID=UPI003BF82882
MLFQPHAHASEICHNWLKWIRPVCQRMHQIWREGDNELYLTGYAWHNRYTYSKEKIDSYNEAAWGGGLGKSYYDQDGDWHGLYAFAFLDSHKNIEPIAGYAFLKTAHLNENIKIGAGVTLFITARSDIFNNIPFPGALPVLSLTYRKASLGALYIPGAQGAGNVLFLLGKYRF